MLILLTNSRKDSFLKQQITLHSSTACERTLHILLLHFTRPQEPEPCPNISTLQEIHTTHTEIKNQVSPFNWPSSDDWKRHKAVSPVEQQNLHCRDRRKMLWHNNNIYFPSHFCGADPLRLIFLSLLALGLLFMLYNVDKSHYGVCVSSGGSCIDYGDRQNAGRERARQIHVLFSLSISAVNCQLNWALHHCCPATAADSGE